MTQNAHTSTSFAILAVLHGGNGRRLLYRYRYCVITTLLFVRLLQGGFAQSLHSKHPCDSKSVFAKASRLLMEKKYAQAEEELGDGHMCYPLSPQDTFTLGVLYGRAHNLQKALALFKSVSPEVPDLHTHLYAVALSQFELKEYQETVNTLQPMAETHDLDPDTANLLGVANSKVGLYQDAYTVLTNELRSSPADLLAHMNLVTLLVDAGKLAEAEQIAGDSVSTFPDNPEVLVMHGATHMLLGRMAEAKNDFKAALRLSPHEASFLFLLALADFNQGDYQGAALAIQTGMEAGVASADLHYLLAECKLKLQPTKPDEAVRELDSAIALDSNAIAARTLRGKLVLDEGRPKGALMDLEVAHRADPDSRSATYNLARTYSALGKAEQARSLYQQLGSKTTDIVGETANQKVMQALGGAR